MAVAIAGSLIGVAILVVWQVGRQAAAHEQAVNEDVKAAFGVWQQAMVTRDGDLLGTLLLDGEAAWTATQWELLASGKALDRRGIGLTLVVLEASNYGIEAEIDVSRDWRSAEITFPLSYARQDDEAKPAFVQLEQTVALVREGSRWLLRRPEEEFWGIWYTRAGKVAAVTFRERDAEIAERFLDDLDRDLGEVCAAATGRSGCDSRIVNVRLESNAAVLLKEIDQGSPAFLGRTFVLPSPTLVGNPLDDSGYEALYAVYAKPIVTTFEASLASPIDPPEQVVQVICFNRHGNLPRLFRYDPVTDEWTAELEDRAFRFLAASPDDTFVALRQHLPREPNRLRVAQWSSGQASVLHDQTYGSLTEHSIGWVETGRQSSLLLAEYQGTTRQPAYHLIEVTDSSICPAAGCPYETLSGFPNWSPDGRHRLIQADGQLSLISKSGYIAADLGEGQNPFWLDERHFGFVRPLAEAQRESQAVVTGVTEGPGLALLWSTADLEKGSIGATASAPFYVQHVEPAGAGQQRLLLYGRQYAGDESRYAIVSLPLADLEDNGGEATLAGAVRVELSLDKTPAGLPSPADPNGHVPFIVSPDGRWLTVAHLAENGSNEWLIHVVEIGQDRHIQYKVGHPGYSFNHPFFDWTLDGRWLLIVDQEFIRLVAPEAGFERIVAHDKRSCSYPTWVIRQGQS